MMQAKLRMLLPLLASTTAVGLVSALLVFLSANSLAWFGAFLAAAALPLYMVFFVATGGAPRTSPRLMTLQIVAVAGVALTVYGAQQGFSDRGFAALAPLAAALLGVGVLEWYVFAYSIYGRSKSDAVVLGQPLPDIEFRNLEGESVSSRDFAGSNTLLVFFRGNWCPLCMAQLRELKKYADELAASSARVKLVSNQSAERMAELAHELQLPGHFEFLRDGDLRAARALSVADIGGTPPGLSGYPADTVMATVIALDADGRVVFGDETDNYRVRPHPEAFLPVFAA